MLFFKKHKLLVRTQYNWLKNRTGRERKKKKHLILLNHKTVAEKHKIYHSAKNYTIYFLINEISSENNFQNDKAKTLFKPKFNTFQVI